MSREASSAILFGTSNNLLFPSLSFRGASENWEAIRWPDERFSTEWAHAGSKQRLV